MTIRRYRMSRTLLSVTKFPASPSSFQGLAHLFFIFFRKMSTAIKEFGTYLLATSVDFLMFGVGQYHQVFNTIVQFVAVNMMYMLARLKITTKFPFHHKAVLSNVSLLGSKWMVGVSYKFVAVLMYISTLPTPISLIPYKIRVSSVPTLFRTTLSSTLSDAIPLYHKLLIAVQASSLDIFHTFMVTPMIVASQGTN